MSDATPAFDFSQFVPGFDFLKNLAAGAAAPGQGAGSVPGLPSLSSWVAPTLSVEEVDKRIQELKTVQYWLEQNGHALMATIQALEVQKMTLSTLRGMNVRMEDLANAFTRNANAASAAVMPQAAAPAAPPPAPSAPPAAAALGTPMTSFFNRMAEAMQPTASGEGDRAAEPAPAESAADARATPVDAGAGGAQDTQDTQGDAGALGAGVVDPLKWWGSLTQQFQHIAESAMKDAAQLQMPVMPQMPGLSASPPAKATRSARVKATGTAGAAKKAAGTGAGATRSKASAPAAGARSTAAAPKAAPRRSAAPAPKPAAPASRRRSRG